MNFKHTNIDPYNVSIEELEAEISRMEKNMLDKYNLQLALKILLNSSYGVIGNNFFVCYNKDIAEAITLQGQDIIMFSSKIINKYFHNYWFDDEEIHEKLNVKVKSKIKGDMVVGGDTDSCEKSTLIKHCSIDNIEDIYKLIKRNKEKPFYCKVKTKSGKDIEIHNDDLLIVNRNNVETEIFGHELQKTDKLISMHRIEYFEDDEVLDIEYFYNNADIYILINNADNIKVNDIRKIDNKTYEIYTDLEVIKNINFDEIFHYEYEMPIESLFLSVMKNNNIIEYDDNKQVIKTDHLGILNYVDNKLKYSKSNYIYRHKVNKAKWELKTELGKSITITNDHSMIVFRNDKKLEVKPSDILNSDKILIVKDNNYYFDNIESCKCIGNFENEWVYDIDINDDTHTFIGNDILVHNSLYISFEEVLKNTEGITDPLKFILDLYEFRLKDYYKDVLKIYAKKWNSENLQDFEMETIAEKGFWLAKKKYALDIKWKEGGSDTYNGQTYQGQFFTKPKRKYTGIEIKKKSTPLYARKTLDELINYLFKYGTNINLNELTKMLKSYKEDFKLQDINDISLMSSISNYNKYVISDKEKIKIFKGCPIHHRAAATYNNLLYNSKYKNKYNFIKSGDKIKFYHIKGGTTHKDGQVFAFPIGVFPIEISPPMDYDTMFNKTIIDPLNRFIKAMNKPLISYTLFTAKRMF